MSAVLAVCVHCGLATYPLTRGFCVECVVLEAPDLPPDESIATEARAIAACRRAGLRAIAYRPDHITVETTDSRGQRWAERRPNLRLTEMPITQRAHRRERTGEFTARDAVDLESYFRMSGGVAGWEQSPFGAMCDRLRETSVKATSADHARFRSDAPSREHSAALAYETEVDGRMVQVTVCAPLLAPESGPSESIEPAGMGGGGKFGSWENGITSYIDARYRMSHVHRALGRLDARTVTVLQCRYAGGEERSAQHAGVDRRTGRTLGALAAVANLTETGKAIRNEGARAGVVMSVRETILHLAEASTSSTNSADERRVSGVWIERIRLEAERLCAAAERAYAESSCG